MFLWILYYEFRITSIELDGHYKLAALNSYKYKSSYNVKIKNI